MIRDRAQTTLVLDDGHVIKKQMVQSEQWFATEFQPADGLVPPKTGCETLHWDEGMLVRPIF